MRRTVLLLALAIGCGIVACSSSSGDGGSGSGPDASARDAPHDDGGPAPGDDGGADGTKPDAPRVTILSLNLHCLKTDGTAFTTNEARFAAVAKTVADEKVDVVLAQEVCKNATGDARAMLTSAFEKATGTAWSSAAAFAHRAWEGTPDEADESVAIFARGELASARETPHRAQGALRRVMLGATAPTKPVPLRVYTVHFDHATPAARADQGREAASLALVETDDEKLGIDGGGGALAMPVIVGGDFNARFDAPPLLAMRDWGFVETSGSAGTTRIDHVFMHRSAPLVAASASEIFEGAAAVSDHPGILVRYAPQAGKPVKLTRVVARGAFAAPLALRGDRAPLSWDRGWPAFPLVKAKEPGAAIVTSELPAAAFVYKFLREDRDWALGDNVSGTGQADNAVTPSFP